MGSPAHYSFFTKAKFYLGYFFYKLMVPFEVKQPRLRFFVYEVMYSTCKFLDYFSQLAYPFHDEMVVTRFGKFAIQRGTSDAAGVSPAYERSDVNHLHKLVERLLARGRRVFFLDIGADIGAYSTALLNRFSSPLLQVMAFEPTSRNFGMLRRNLALNGHEEGKRLRLLNCAVGNLEDDRIRLHFDPLAPGSSGLAHESSTTSSVEVESHSLDKMVIPFLDECDEIIMKIDVEGMEIPVLQGASKLLASGRGIHIVIEDFVDTAIVEYLQGSTKLKFVAKRTAYNSWWSSQ